MRERHSCRDLTNLMSTACQVCHDHRVGIMAGLYDATVLGVVIDVQKLQAMATLVMLVMSSALKAECAS